MTTKKTKNKKGKNQLERPPLNSQKKTGETYTQSTEARNIETENSVRNSGR